MKRARMSLAAAAAVAAAGCAHPVAVPAEPLFDGRCDEYVDGDVLYADESVTLFARETRDHVWLCYTLPPESFGILDLMIDAPGLDAPLNLHVSAQLGEWPADRPDLAPQTGESAQWWNNRGWSANPAQFNGYRGEGADRRARFRPFEGREAQLSKARFGRGAYALRLTIYSVAGPDGERRDLILPPEDAPALTLTVD